MIHIVATVAPQVVAGHRYHHSVAQERTDQLTGMLAEAWSGRGKTASRYLAVSVINIVNHQALLYLANSVWHWAGGWANVFAAMVAAIPAYLLSRAWVWEISGRHDWRTEVLPFWIIALLGMGVSSVFAEMADRWFGAGLVVNLASLVGYFLVWIAKFFLLDKVFVRRNASEAEVGAGGVEKNAPKDSTPGPSLGEQR